MGSSKGAILVRTISGADGGDSAFLAHFVYRDSNGSYLGTDGTLPVDGDRVSRSVGGGSPDKPTDTVLLFDGPETTAKLDLHVLPGASKDRPVLAQGLKEVVHPTGGQSWTFQASPASIGLEVNATNGPAGDRKAFVAAVRFRDVRGSEIDAVDGSLYRSKVFGSFFYVSSGDETGGATTRALFETPPGASTLTVTVHPWTHSAPLEFVAPPRPIVSESLELATRPMSRVAESAIGRGSYYVLPLGVGEHLLSVTMNNGGPREKRAFIAKVRFFNIVGEKVEPDVGTFASSARAGSFFYVSGGSQKVPTVSRHRFRPPAGATVLELRILPWKSRTTPDVSGHPFLTTDRPGADAVSTLGRKDVIEQRAETPPVRSRIARMVEEENPSLVGVFDDEFADRCAVPGWGDMSIDNYEHEWDSRNATHVVIKVTTLSTRLGWANTLTLREGQSTIELATMALRAKSAGLSTVLVLPEDLQPYPLLSRVTRLFSIVADESSVLEHFAKMTRGAGSPGRTGQG